MYCAVYRYALWITMIFFLTILVQYSVILAYSIIYKEYYEIKIGNIAFYIIILNKKSLKLK
jgi:hypothetical protein